MTYTITDTQKTQSIAGFFVTEPAHCVSRLVYAHNVLTDSNPVCSSNIGGDGESFDANDLEFTYYYTGSNDLAGNTADGTDYDLTLYVAID